jgi:hypothetical protein
LIQTISYSTPVQSEEKCPVISLGTRHTSYTDPWDKQTSFSGYLVWIFPDIGH